jgi:hypothetical protein
LLKPFAFNAIFTKDGNRVVTFAGGRRVSLWQLSTRQEEAMLQAGSPDEYIVANSGQLSVSANG